MSQTTFLWSFLKSLILDSCELYVPKSHTYMRRFPKWFNGEIIHRIHKVRSLRKKHRMFPSVRNTLFHKNAESNLLTNINEAKSEFESRLVKTLPLNETTISITIFDHSPNNRLSHQSCILTLRKNLLHLARQPFSMRSSTLFLTVTLIPSYLIHLTVMSMTYL